MPRTPTLALCAALCAPLSGAASRQEPASGGAEACFELESERSVRYVGESFSVRALFGFPEGWATTHLVPLFRQELELPIEIELPSPSVSGCLESLPQAPEAPDSAGPRLVVAGKVARARALGVVARRGEPFELHLLERSFRAVAPGRVELSGARLRWAAASDFQDDLLAGRVPLDREEHVLAAPPLALEIRALPEDGRPAGFTGAVGEFTVSARAEPRDLVEGETLRVTLELRGGASLDGFDFPRPAWSGFTCLGTLEGRAQGARTIAYDLRVESSAVREVPPIDFPYFRPAPEPGYAVRATSAIPILVRPRPASPIGGERVSRPGPGEGSAWPVVLAGVLAALGAGAWIGRRARAHRRGR